MTSVHVIIIFLRSIMFFSICFSNVVIRLRHLVLAPVRVIASEVEISLRSTE